MNINIHVCVAAKVLAMNMNWCIFVLAALTVETGYLLCQLRYRHCLRKERYCLCTRSNCVV